MSFEPHDYLRHIQVEINFVIEKSQGVSLERFLDDATLQRAFVRSIEVIGEAASTCRNLSGCSPPTSRGEGWRQCVIG